MDPNDHPPGGTSNRVLTISLTRDTLILIAALVLLGLAIFLAVIFPSTNSQGSQAVATNTASTRATTAVQPTPSAPAAQGDGALATPGAPPQPQPYPATGATAPSNPGIGAGVNNTTPYPGPAGVAELPTQTQPTTAAPTAAIVEPNGPPTPSLPTFSPSRPTSGAPAAGQTTAYPAPGGRATQPTLPSFPTATPALFEPQATPQPTTAPAPTVTTAPPTAQPTTRPPTPGPAGGVRPDGSGPAATPAPAAPPVDVLKGNVHWTPAQSPVVIPRDLLLPKGAALVIDPGVEVRLGPGVSFYVEGELISGGQPGQPVRFIGTETSRWEGLFGRRGGRMTLNHTEIRGGGNGGTVLVSEGGTISIQNGLITDNGGHIQIINSVTDVQNTEISGNDMPYGAALEIGFDFGGNSFVTLIGNRIGGNRMATGAPPILVNNQSSFDTVLLTAQRNLLIGQDGPNLVLSANGPFQGDISCNTMINGANGLSIRSETLQVPGFALNVRDNAIEDHTPPIIPIYLEFGIGRGATSEVALDMRNNWWESPTGPYEPDRYADGRGESVGENIEFIPWLTERPACAPPRP